MQEKRTRHRASGWAFIGLCALSLAAQARIKAVDPGELPELAPDEGLVVVAVDSNVPLHDVRFIKDGKVLGSGVMKHLEAGRSFGLYVASAGVYEWREVELFFGWKYKLSDDPEFTFKVEPGKITYPGDLLFRPSAAWTANVSVSNRGLAAIDWLQAQHPTLYARYPLVYSGHYPDPFPAFYRQARASHPDASAPESVALKPPPSPGTLPLAVGTLWKPDRIVQARLNPAGNLLALHVRESDDAWGVELVDLAAGTAAPISRSPVAFDSMEWSGDDNLILSAGAAGQLDKIMVVRIDTGKTAAQRYSLIALPSRGVLVDSLPQDRNHVLFGSVTQHGELMVHAIDISSQKAANRFSRTFRSRLNTGIKDDIAWFTDGEGRLRMAVVKRDDEYVLMNKRDGVFAEVMKLSGEDGLDPTGLSYDASIIYARTDRDREQRDLVAYDVASGKIVRTLFSKPGVDVVSAIFDSHRDPIGVTYYQGGRLVSEYFSAGDEHLGRILQQAFPGKTVLVADRSRDGQQMVMWVDGGDQPPALYHLDAAARRASLVEISAPWLADARFAPTEVVKFDGADGLAMEAFLTLPPGENKRPLVVFPHGGPIGIADTLHFDREVQFIASLGYAVLRVNYRGSSGYGKAFREAGYHSYGTLIEDDIDAAIEHVLANYPLDVQRMCVVGSSYGGYSALVAAVRRPQRFRCVVSISGVSDRALFFTASDSGRSEEGRKLLEKIIGDPNADLAQMQETSPLYRYQDIQVPVMLVHGLEDRRVDYEHTRRMLRMLDLAGRTPVGLEFAGEGHGFEKAENIEKLWNGVAGFLRQHLGDPNAAAP